MPLWFEVAIGVAVGMGIFHFLQSVSRSDAEEVAEDMAESVRDSAQAIGAQVRNLPGAARRKVLLKPTAVALASQDTSYRMRQLESVERASVRLTALKLLRQWQADPAEDLDEIVWSRFSYCPTRVYQAAYIRLLEMEREAEAAKKDMVDRMRGEISPGGADANFRPLIMALRLWRVTVARRFHDGSSHHARVAWRSLDVTEDEIKQAYEKMRLVSAASGQEPILTEEDLSDACEFVPAFLGDRSRTS